MLCNYTCQTDGEVYIRAFFLFLLCGPISEIPVILNLWLVSAAFGLWTGPIIHTWVIVVSFTIAMHAHVFVHFKFPGSHPGRRQRQLVLGAQQLKVPFSAVGHNIWSWVVASWGWHARIQFGWRWRASGIPRSCSRWCRRCISWRGLKSTWCWASY